MKGNGCYFLPHQTFSPRWCVLVFLRWLACLQSQGTPEIQISWRSLGGTWQAAYVSQIMCTQTCNLQIISKVLISHINSRHFVGIVSTGRSPGLLPAARQPEKLFHSKARTGRQKTEGPRAGWCDTHTHTHTHIGLSIFTGILHWLPFVFH